MDKEGLLSCPRSPKDAGVASLLLCSTRPSPKHMPMLISYMVSDVGVQGLDPTLSTT